MNWRNRNNIKRNLAVTEIVGAILMLGIATSSFSVIYYQVVNAPTPNSAPIVELSGSIDNNQVIVTHCGGESLDLDTKLVLNIGGTRKSFKVGDFLDSISKEDGAWGLSEKFVYPLDYDFDYSMYPDLDINVVDRETGSLLMSGVTNVDPVCDIGIEVSVDNQFPGMETNIVFTIKVTNNGNINESNVKIKFNKPDELVYYSNTTTQGVYDNSLGIWDVGFLNPEQSEFLIVELIVGNREFLEDTQLLMLLDGSGSITPGDWALQLEGLAAAIENEVTFPHDSSAELTVVQFGGGNWNSHYPGYAKLEIGPVVVNEANYISLANSIRNIIQLNYYTPTACGIYMGADTVVKSSLFNPNIRQVILMVTDGDPTNGCNCDGDYKADNLYSGFKKSAEDARNYLINKLGLTIDQDEFNAIAVGQSAPHASWLKEKIVWPEPSYYAPPFLIGGTRRGWLRNVSTWEEFTETIDECFGIIFNQIPVNIQISSKTFSDPKIVNDISDIVVVPCSSPTVITNPATDILETNATFNMYYNFKWFESGWVRFMYQISSIATWQYTPWEYKSGAGYYSKRVTGLSSGNDYFYRAQLKYDNKTINVVAEFFTTPLSTSMS